jgi:hypothetical protein
MAAAAPAPKISLGAKANLVVARGIERTSSFPLKTIQTAQLVGAVNHSVVGNFFKAASEGYNALGPRGIAKLGATLLTKSTEAVGKSMERADANTKAIAPVVEGIANLGIAIGTPAAVRYATEAGSPAPDHPAIVNALLKSPFFVFPSGDQLVPPKEEAAAAAPAEGPPPEQQAAPA